MPSSKKAPVKKAVKKYSGRELLEISAFNNANPHSVLGPHPIEKDKSLVINAYLPLAIDAWIKIKGKKVQKIPMKRLSPDNIFQAVLENTKDTPLYKIGYTDAEDRLFEFDDPYRFEPQIGDVDIYLFKEGNHLRIYDKLGARAKNIDKVKGVLFNVWAPNAKSVSVAGIFNAWKEGAHPMRNVNGSGIWELFIPGIGDGEIYKYAVKSQDGSVCFKSDPFAFEAELRPDTASVVNSLKSFKWSDDDWLKKRKKWDYRTSPVSIYEVHLSSWKRDFSNDDFPNVWGFKTYRQLAHEITEHVLQNGYTHVELMPVMEHPLDISWGYQVINYYAPTSRFGKPEDFMYFVDYLHSHNIGVILDWVPAHFPMDAHGLADFDGKQIYAYESIKKAYHKDWGTLVFDYGRNEVCNFLISNALFWFHKYHIDGLRVDAVASMLYLDYSRDEGEWEPNVHGGRENLEAVEFLKNLNEKVHKYYKGIMMIAEESTSWPGVTRPVYLGGLGFDMKWNMGWMHDSLDYFSKDPIYRKFHHNKITFSLWYSFNENFLLPISHDEVVYGKRSLIDKMPGDLWQRFANLRLYFGFMYGHPGKKLNFMGNDIAQYLEWNCEDEVNWRVMDIEHNNKFNIFFKELQRVYKKHDAFFDVDFESKGFNWIDFSDSENSVLSFVRFSENRKEILLFTFNMTPLPRYEYVLGVPAAGFYKEILNSDAEEYGGSGLGNYGGVHSRDEKRYEWRYSVKVTLPPLAVNIYKYEEPEKPEETAGDIIETEIEAEEPQAEKETKIEDDTVKEEDAQSITEINESLNNNAESE